MKRTRESMSYHSTVSIPLMVFVCESQQCHAALSIVITSSHRALVSPWMDNGNALSYVKTPAEILIVVDSRHSRRYQGPPLYVHRPWKFESRLCPFMILAYEHADFLSGKCAYWR